MIYSVWATRARTKLVVDGTTARAPILSDDGARRTADVSVGGVADDRSTGVR